MPPRLAVIQHRTEQPKPAAPKALEILSEPGPSPERKKPSPTKEKLLFPDLWPATGASRARAAVKPAPVKAAPRAPQVRGLSASEDEVLKAARSEEAERLGLNLENEVKGLCAKCGVRAPGQDTLGTRFAGYCLQCFSGPWYDPEFAPQQTARPSQPAWSEGEPGFFERAEYIDLMTARPDYTSSIDHQRRLFAEMEKKPHPWKATDFSAAWGTQ